MLQSATDVGRLTLSTIDQVTIETGLHEAMAPLIRSLWRMDAGFNQGVDGRLVARVVGAVGAVVVPAVGELALCAGQALLCFLEVDGSVVNHAGHVQACP